MRKEIPEKISIDFAINLLKNLYNLDIYMGEISEVCDQLLDDDKKNKLVQALGGLMYAILNDLMIPIYRQHPALGTADEPGPWLNKG
jgi:hypothetical protein